MPFETVEGDGPAGLMVALNRRCDLRPLSLDLQETKAMILRQSWILFR